MDDMTLAVVGNVTAEPRTGTTGAGEPMTTFRLARNQRTWDPVARTYVDQPASFVSVSCFRSLAVHVAGSIRKGERVFVHGRMRIVDWENEERKGTSVRIAATTVGHDLLWGTSAFTKAARPEPLAVSGQTDADAMLTEMEIAPFDESEEDFVMDLGSAPEASPEPVPSADLTVGRQRSPLDDAPVPAVAGSGGRRRGGA